MSQVHCVRCGKDAEGLMTPPLPSALGESIKSNVCDLCWKEWMTMSTKVINEYRLQLFRPDHRQILEEQMKAFLNISS